MANHSSRTSAQVSPTLADQNKKASAIAIEPIAHAEKAARRESEATGTRACIAPEHSVFSEQVYQKALKLKAVPFVRYADEAFAASMGIETLIGLLRQGEMNRQADDGTATLSEFDVNSLLGLAQFAASALLQNADSLRAWADQCFVGEETYREGGGHDAE